MVTNLSHWDQYLSVDDISVIENFIQKCQNGTRADYFLVFSATSCNRKTTLAKEIANIIGKDNW